MRNATCVGTQTLKVPTRVTLLFIPYTVAGIMVMRCVMRRAWTQKLLFCAPTVYSLNCDQRFQQKRDFCFIPSLCLHRLMHYLCISQCVLKIFSLNHTCINLVLKAQIVGRVQSRTTVNFSCDYRLNNIALQVEAKIPPFQHCIY